MVNESQKKPTQVGKFGGQLNVPLVDPTKRISKESQEVGLLLSDGQSPRSRMMATMPVSPDNLISNASPMENIREVTHSNSMDNFIQAKPVVASPPQTHQIGSMSRTVMSQAGDPETNERGNGYDGEENFESMTAGGDSAIINEDLENIKDGMGHSIRLQDNIYNKLLHNVGTKEQPAENRSEIRPSVQRRPQPTADNIPRSSINLTNALRRDSRSIPTRRGDNNSGILSADMSIKPDQIVSGQVLPVGGKARAENKPSVMLSPNEMTLSLEGTGQGVRQPSGKKKYLLAPIKDTQEEISMFFRKQYANAGKARAGPLADNKPATPAAPRRRSASSDSFLKMKIQKLENLFKLDVK